MGAGVETGAGTRKETQDGDGDRDGDGNVTEGSSGDENNDGSGNGDKSLDGNEKDNGEGRGGERAWQSATSGQKKTIRPGTILTRGYLCRREVVLSGSQKLRAQNLAPARRCGTRGDNRTGHQGREGGTGDGIRNAGGDGNENENRNGDTDEGGNGNGNGERRVEGRESPRFYEAIVEVIEVGRTTRERG